MDDKFKLIKIYPSNGLILNKQGKRIGLVWMFRPNIKMNNKYWFEDISDNNVVMCVEVCSEGIPINCKQVHKNYETFDGPSECEKIPEKDILKRFELCCHLVLDRKEDDEMQKLGGEIIEDMLSDREKK